MIKSAVKKGEFVKNEQNGKTYQIVMFDELVYLVEVEKIAEGVEKLTAADFWKVSGKYFAANFTKVESEQAPAPEFIPIWERREQLNLSESAELENFEAARFEFEKAHKEFKTDTCDTNGLTTWTSEDADDAENWVFGAVGKYCAFRNYKTGEVWTSPEELTL